ncbi:HdeD family acid-resistance protein [Amycolatopsis sp. 3B14]|uniref:HdeD family acid-resistance protein n=1 Tax=Amycolatopsis sp. 3B14 TaxID=3243600 RepID=UPI003D981541
MAAHQPYGAFRVTLGAGAGGELRRVTGRWWMVALLGVATAVLGVLLLVNLAVAVGTLAVIVAIALLFEGFDEVLTADRHRTRWPSYLLGVVWIGIGVIALAWPGITLLTLAVVVGVGFVVAGAGQIAASLAWRRRLPMWGLWLGLGVVTLLIGVVALVWPDLTILTLAIWLGIALVLRGAGALRFALQLRRAHQAMAA